MTSARDTTFVALLRGVNVSGKNLLPMKELAAIFERADCADVRTYIQSGNVVFRAPADAEETIGPRVAAEITRRFGLKVPVLVRTETELRAIARKHPLHSDGLGPEHLHVVFLADAPTKARAASLDPKRSPPDAFVVKGREIYLCCPNGMGKSKLTNAYFDSKLATTSSARNWRTVQKLVEMCDA